jgi:drug/metabolite transporter (DMT)-like permease
MRFAPGTARTRLRGMSSTLRLQRSATDPGDAAAGARSERDGQLLLVGGNLLLGTLGIFVEEAGQDPLTTTWFRCVFGLLALLAWGLFTRRVRLPMQRPAWRELAASAGAGGLMVASWCLSFAAIPLCSFAVSTVIFHLQPFWLLVVGAAFLGERVTRVQWLAVGVALAGLVFASGLVERGGVAGSTHGYALGVALSVTGSLVYAAAALAARAQARQADALAQATGQCAVGAIALAPWALRGALPDPGAAWGWLAGLGVLHTGLAYVMLYAGMARLGTGRIAVLAFVYPLTAVLLDWAVYGRALSGLQLLGVSLIGAALWTLRRPR